MQKQPVVPTMKVVLTDANQIERREMAIPENDFGPRIMVHGVAYDHIDTRHDGVWIYAPNKR